MDLSRFSRIRFAHLPTPLEEAPALWQAAGIGPRLFVKRDDCTGLALGGNKTRKLEFTMAAAQDAGADVIITTGGLQSNHVRQTAAAAARIGIEFHAVLDNPLGEKSYQESDEYVSGGNRLLVELLNGKLHLAAGKTTTAQIVDGLVAELSSAGRKPYVVPLGASDGVGALGYVACAQEMLMQFASQDLTPSHLFVATGSCGTQAGLLAGLHAAGSSIRVIGVSVSEPAAAKQRKIRRVLDDLAAFCGAETSSVHDEQIVVADEYFGEGYGLPTSTGIAALRLAAKTEGLLLDPVYTAKALAGCLDFLQTGNLAEARDVVFLHTGGSPALFAYPELIS